MTEFPKYFYCAGPEYGEFHHYVPAPLFRRSFNLDSAPVSSELIICGLGFYELYVNGKKATKGYLAPYITNPDQLLPYDRYDLTALLSPGENVIGVILGNGMQNPLGGEVWNFETAVYRAAPEFALSFEAETASGKTAFDASSFVWERSEILFDSLRSGVVYDANRKIPGWNEPGFDDSSWNKPVPGARQRGEAFLCEAPPVIAARELKPVSVRAGECEKYHVTHPFVKPITEKYDMQIAPPAEKGGYIYDFGENTAGTFRLKITGKKGQKVSIQAIEHLVDGKANYQNHGFYPAQYCQHCLYICSGEGEETFEMPFSYFGCRYLYVDGITEAQATPELLTFIVLHSDMKLLGRFECSDSSVNALYEMALRSDLSNFIHFPTDCPHREKNGWTGDGAWSAEHMILSFDASECWSEWLRQLRHVQRIDGRIPGIVPTPGWGFDWGSGPAWDTVIFNIPYIMYKYRGNTKVITDNAEMMMRYLFTIAGMRSEKGLVAYGLGDWVPTGKGCEDYDSPLEVTDTLCALGMCQKAEEMFSAVGLKTEADYARSLGIQFKNAFRENLIDQSDMSVAGRCQTSQAFALYFGIFTEAEKPEAFKRLVEYVHSKGDSFDSGFLGLRTVFHVLAENGEAELAYHMIMKRDYPSYAHLIDIGYTTLPEQFLPDGNTSLSDNHHFLGDISHFFMRQLAGINVISSDTVLIRPHFVKELEYVKAEYEMPNGTVKVEWKRDNGGVKAIISAPASINVSFESTESNVTAEFVR